MSVNGGFIKCECGSYFDSYVWHDCPDCYEEEYDRYVEEIIARTILEKRFRDLTPPPDRRRMSTGGSRSTRNPLR